jgi:hypothetical protein
MGFGSTVLAARKRPKDLDGLIQLTIVAEAAKEVVLGIK